MSIWRPYTSVDTILIVNFGGQYTHLISRRVRELSVYTEIVHYYNLSRDVIDSIKPRAIILSGGPSSIYEENAPRIDSWILDLGIPVLGICYGHQLIASMIGGRVERGYGEYGRTRIRIIERDPIFDGWSSEEDVWMSHSDYVAYIPSDKAKILAVSVDKNYIAAFRLIDRSVYGVQFHPEVIHTPKGRKLIENFVIGIAGAKPMWNPGNIIENIVNEIRSTVGEDEKVLCAVSGGIDSTTTALLVKKAIGDRLVAVFVNHGLLREGEAEEVLNMLRNLGINPIYIDASKMFLDALKGVRDCEEKRRIIGELFAKIFKDIVESDKFIKWLAQGTTYPDVIESGFVPGADRIKSHHNVAGLPSWLGLKLLEPIKYLYKDEVRAIALRLGVPEDWVYRHPFPGPGLAVRIIGEITEEKLRIVRRASKIVEEELRRSGLYRRVWQAFAVVGDDKWVGVKGDRRAVGYIVTIRIVESEDGMTADWSRIPLDVLDNIARRITSEIPEVTMVTYAITSKPPSTIEPC
ncbi:GMP synthase (glutamine-hydrolyzing) [Ignisphaera aggregans DSM 17230]|uniref:GMP synthase [glutamine-hydrolyzing] n=1 Tax=Ignisphaera aggregans (strain DSM 17230 / JCM 13409 / AQ1.S1) TaxID=583356 RepID=E0SSD9_IGNAA|nr:GMP synthase (glutamine-hydrolyzing) [Ignisphaera aggregans DSM 17230]